MTWVSSKWGKCPFCKGDSKTAWHLGTYWTVVCNKCLCQGPRAKTEEEAIELWNRRAKE